ARPMVNEASHHIWLRRGALTAPAYKSEIVIVSNKTSVMSDMHRYEKPKNMKELATAMAASNPLRRPKSSAVPAPVTAMLVAAAKIDGTRAARCETPKVLNIPTISQ